MKIHIVQKGDTLWELSKQYGVDFEELKQVNSHLASPDMIMPGMKIKIPSTSKAVKKETQMPYKDTSPKPLPVIEEDDKEKQKVVKPEMPVQPLPQMPMQPIMQMPILEQDFQFNFPQMPSYPEPKKEEVKKEAKKEVKVEPQPQPQMEMPVQQPMPEMPIQQPIPQIQMPIQQQMPQIPVQQPIFQPMPHYPCCFHVHPCYPYAPPYPAMIPEAYMPAEFLPKKPLGGDCGCGSSSVPQPTMEAPMSFYPEQAAPEQVFNTEQNIAQTYPPQFNTNPVYPTPPTYPNFSSYQRKDDDEKKSTDE